MAHDPTRNRRMNPEELGRFVASLVSELRADAVAEEQNGPPERSRLRADEARRARDEAALIRDAEERRARIVEQTLAHVIPPKIFNLITGKNGKAFQTEAATCALDWWEAAQERICVLYGGMGSGKSVGAGLVAKHAVETGKRSVSWHRPNDFVSAILHAYDDDAPDVGKDLVVLDDMGRETKTDFVEALTSFIDNRNTRLIITTNEEPRRWNLRYDPRLIQRIQDEGVAYAIKAESMRQKGWGF